MKANPQQQQALLTFIGRIYDEIRAVEQGAGIQAGAADYRPRIEYFHDAIREFSAGRSNGYEKAGRLTVESLAYDMSLLKQIVANPVSKTNIPQRLSPGTAVAVSDVPGSKPSSDVRHKLTDLYKNYTLLFVTILVEAADRNFFSRAGEHDNEVEELAAMEDALREAHTHVDVESLLTAHIEAAEVRKKLLAALGKTSNSANVKAAIKAQIKAVDAAKANLDKGHMSYLSSQLTIYQESRDMVKKMAVSGMNIVGDFLGAAMAEATRASRGR